jgi:hypothetical protein
VAVTGTIPDILGWIRENHDCVIRCGDESFGVRIDAVTDTARNQAIAPVAKALRLGVGGTIGGGTDLVGGLRRMFGFGNSSEPQYTLRLYAPFRRSHDAALYDFGCASGTTCDRVRVLWRGHVAREVLAAENKKRREAK